MESIPKFFATIITIMLAVLICVSFIISSVVVNSARTYHASVIEEIEASGFDRDLMESCLETATGDNYSLFIEQLSSVEFDPQSLYKVTLQYNLVAPIFGRILTGTIVGYAGSGGQVMVTGS